MPTEDETHEYQRRRVQDRIAEPEGYRGPRRRLTLAQTDNYRRGAAGAHHAGKRQQAAPDYAAESRSAQQSRNPFDRQQSLDSGPQQQTQNHRLPDRLSVR